GYLGKDFLVKSSYGHIRDLVKTDDAIDTEDNFKQKYEVPADKKAIVSELKKLAKSAEMVWLASDEDREGEAISWHLYETLGLKRLEILTTTWSTRSRLDAYWIASWDLNCRQSSGAKSNLPCPRDGYSRLLYA